MSGVKAFACHKDLRVIIPTVSQGISFTDLNLIITFSSYMSSCPECLALLMDLQVLRLLVHPDNWPL